MESYRLGILNDDEGEVSAAEDRECLERRFQRHVARWLKPHVAEVVNVIPYSGTEGPHDRPDVPAVPSDFIALRIS